MRKNMRELPRLLQEAAWLFGNRAFDGACCGGLSFFEYQALARIELAESCSIQEVGDALKFTKSGATRIIDRLERKGYARRRRSPRDGRVCCVTVTAQGKKACSQVKENYGDYIEDSLRGLDARTLKLIKDALSALLSAVKPSVPVNSEVSSPTGREPFS